MYKFLGSLEDLKLVLNRYNIMGTWKSEKAGNSVKYMFRSILGGIINFWTTGTVLFQGKEPDCSALERALSQFLVTDSDEIQIEYRPVEHDPIAIPRTQILPIRGCKSGSSTIIKRIGHQKSHKTGGTI